MLGLTIKSKYIIAKRELKEVELDDLTEFE